MSDLDLASKKDSPMSKISKDTERPFRLSEKPDDDRD